MRANMSYQSQFDHSLLFANAAGAFCGDASTERAIVGCQVVLYFNISCWCRNKAA
jgi:hypothetical protein